MKIVVFFLGVVFGGVGWLAILFNSKHPNRYQLANMWGFDAPGMKEHWDRWSLRKEPFMHLTKNLLAEWVQVEGLAQRGYKVLSLLALVMLLLGILIGLAIALVLIWVF